MKKVIVVMCAFQLGLFHVGNIFAGVISDVAVRAANQAVVVGFSSPAPRVAFVGKVTTSTGATFGRGTVVGSGVTAGTGSTVGTNVRVGNNVTIDAGANVPSNAVVPDGARVHSDGSVTLKSGEKTTVQSLVR